MKSTKIAWLALFIALTALAVAATGAWFSYGRHKSGYIVLKKVFDEFEMSKQYKQKLEAVTIARKNIMDSLELNLNAESRALQADKSKPKDKISQFEFDRQYYLEKRKQFKEDNDALTQQYDAEVIKQMNQYVKDYGEKMGYDLILGAEGNGALMYGSEQLNITDQVIKYVNERYKGASK